MSKKNEVVEVEFKSDLPVIAIDDNGKLYMPKEIAEHLKKLKAVSKQIENYEKHVRTVLKTEMEKYGVDEVKADGLAITLVAPTEYVKLDSKLVEQLYPKIYDSCSKIVEKKSYVTIK